MPEYTLPDPAVSVHVSYAKARFATFRRATKGQGLLSANNIIPMEGWRELSMPLRVGSQMKIVISKNSRFDLEVSIEPGLGGLLGGVKDIFGRIDQARLENLSDHWHYDEARQ